MSEESLVLGSRFQKLLKGLHVTFVAFTLGGLLSMLIILLVKQQVNAQEDPFPFDLSFYQLFNYAVNYCFYGIMLTGFTYSLFTKWGFFKHRWITVKWVCVLILFVFVWVRFGPAVNGMVALADAGFATPWAQNEYVNYAAQSRLFTLIEGTVLVVIVFISVLKPWGMTKRQWKVNKRIQVPVVGAVVLVLLVFLLMNSLTLRKYRNMRIADSDLSALADGTYLGEAKIGGFRYEVEARILDHALVDIRIVRNRKSPYARFAEGVIRRIIENQNANVDAITGATTTSKALMKAVENAFAEQAP